MEIFESYVKTIHAKSARSVMSLHSKQLMAVLNVSREHLSGDVPHRYVILRYTVFLHKTNTVN